MRAIETVVSECSAAALAVSDQERGAMARLIADAHRVFVAGAGRSGLVARAFANRLVHLGLSVSVVGEITCAHTAPGDVLVVGSGSGETGSLVQMVAKAKNAGLRVALVTASPDSTIAREADVTVVIPAASKGQGGSAQPMASTFEQASLLTYDSIVLLLMDLLGESSVSMYARHADLE